LLQKIIFKTEGVEGSLKEVVRRYKGISLAIIPAFGLTLYSGLEQRRHARLYAVNGALELANKASNDQEHLIERTHQLLVALPPFLNLTVNILSSDCLMVCKDRLKNHYYVEKLDE